MRDFVVAALLLLVTFALAPVAALAYEETWLKVDTDAMTLEVMRGDVAVATFENIAIGSNGVTRDKRLGDERTPLGNYQVTAIRDSQRFTTFIAINYPTPGQVHRACSQGDVSAADCERLKRADANGRPAPQDTALGGHLGIHGTGAGSLEIHGSVNWTDGCIALNNEQLAELLQWIAPGTRVSVR